MRRALVVLAVGVFVAGGAWAASAPDIVRVGKPAFAPPLGSAPSSGELRLRLVSTTLRAPTLTPLPTIPVPAGAPETLSGERGTHILAQPGTTFVLYGTAVIAAFGPRGGMKYAFDLRSFGFPPTSLVPNAYGPQEVSWARQVGRTLVVQTNHLGYAKDSGNRNGYLTAIEIDTGKVRWRSPSLVANAHSFVVFKGLVVSGYGFTAEKDWLYLTDAKTGRVGDRLALPSMAERISVKGDRIVVRCYDAVVVARLVPA